MAVFGNAVLTEVGKNLVYNVIADEGSIEFTRVVVGKGEYSASEKTPENLKTKTSLKAVEQSYTINFERRESGYYIRLGTLITNYDPDTRDPITSEDFYLNEMGIMAKAVGSNTEILYGITVCATERGDFVPVFNGNNPIEIMQDFSVFVSTDVNVSLEYPETAYARADDVEDQIADTVEYIDDRIEAVEGDIATVESSLVASHAYDVGEYLIYDDALYIVTADIASGDSLVIDTNIEATNVGEEICDLKKSVSDGKTLVAGAITDNGVTTAADATFQTMADNIGDILEANPGSISSSVNVGVGYTQDVSISAPITINTAGYHSTDTGTRTEGSKSLLLENKGDNVELLSPTSGTPATAGRIAKTPGTISSSVSVAQDSTNSYFMNISAPMTVGTAGQHSSSVGTRTAGTKQIGLVNNGDKVNAVTNDSSMTVCASVDKTAGTITSSVNTSAGTSSTVSISAPMTINTDGHHSSNVGTRTAGSKSLTLANNGANVELKDGTTVIGKVAKTTGSVTSSASFNSGTSTTVTAKSTMTLTAGHISSKGTEGTATAYLRRSGNDVYLSSSSSGGTNYGKYSIPTQTKTGSPTTSDVTVSPDSGYLLSSVTAKAPHQLRDYFYAGTLFSGSHAYYDDAGTQKTTGTHVYMTYGTAGYTGANNYIGRPVSDFGTATAAQILSGKTATCSGGFKASGTLLSNAGSSREKIATGTNLWFDKTTEPTLSLSSSIASANVLVIIITHGSIYNNHQNPPYQRYENPAVVILYRGDIANNRYQSMINGTSSYVKVRAKSNTVLGIIGDTGFVTETTSSGYNSTGPFKVEVYAMP